MLIEEYVNHDAVSLASLVHSGQVSPEELLTVAIKLNEQLNPKVNAVNHLMIEKAVKQAKSVNRSAPFAGVPILIKDLLCHFAGEPLSSGSAAMRSFVSERHSFIIQRLIDAGFVIFGKTNTPECGLMGTTEPKAFGATRNPWRLEDSSGGSSGGSAAAVASRVVPLASAGDGGGSIRIPASLCGLFGLKPTRGRVSNGPQAGDVWFGAVCQHVLTRSVRDSAYVLDLISGYQPGDPYSAPSQAHLFSAALNKPHRRMRIAVSKDSPFGMPVDSEVQGALTDSIRKLKDLGHEVIEAEPSIAMEALLSSFIESYYVSVAREIDLWENALGASDISADLEASTVIFRRIGQRYSAFKHDKNLLKWHDFSATLETFLKQYDAFLLPVTAAHRWAIGDMPLKAWEERLIHLIDRMGLSVFFTSQFVSSRTKGALQKVPFTQLANLTGHPAMSVPLYQTDQGVPVGVQFIGRFGDESTLFELAAALERHDPWSLRVPPLLGSL